MKKIIIKLGICILIFISIITLNSLNIQTLAKDEVNNDPYKTYIVGLDGELNESPLAYEGVLVINPGLNEAKDICIKNNHLYIADTGNKVVWIYDINNNSYEKIGEGILVGPSGVAVDDELNIYVADYDAKAVFKFDSLGNLLFTYLQPTEALFGEESQYRPTKVAVDMRGDIYITSEGNANGIIQLNKDGEFVGYFGPNLVNMTLSLFFKRLVLSKEDRETYASLSPKVTTNLTIDNKNIVYTCIEGETGTSLKKYNVNGTNILNKDGFYSSTYQDLTTDSDGFIYTVDNSDSNVIQVMDPEGTLLFTFGLTKSGSMTLGQFDKALGIAVDDSGNIWVLDSVGNNIQMFRKTEYASLVFDAINAYNAGEYETAQANYETIISQNASFVNAYIGLGKIYQRYEDYDQAGYYFKIANYKTGYSEIYWELRDNWLRHNFIWIVVIIVLLVIMRIFHLGSKLIKLIPSKVKDWFNKISQTKFMDELKYLFRILKKPADTFYDIKFLLKIRIRTALIIYLGFILINIFGSYIFAGYLFKPNSLENVNFFLEVLKWIVILIGGVFANYLISSLQSGEGMLRDLLIGTVYSFAPIIIFKLPLSILTNVLTYNESYLYTIINSFLWLWVAFNLIYMIKEMHNFTIKELIINLILTIVAIVIILLLLLVIYILAQQLIEFIIGLIEEGVFRT